MKLGIMFRNGWSHMVTPGLVAPRSASGTKCKESLSADVCIQITQTDSQLSIQNQEQHIWEGC